VFGNLAKKTLRDLSATQYRSDRAAEGIRLSARESPESFWHSTGRRVEQNFPVLIPGAGTEAERDGSSCAFRNIMNAALGRAKDGEGWTRRWSRFLATCLVKALGKLLAKNAGRCAGAESEKRFFKSKTTSLPKLTVLIPSS
jgi:hypothetical protein